MSSDGSHADEVLDPGALDQLRALQRPGRPNLLARVVNLFLTDAPKQVETMRASAETGADEDLMRAAHTLKSSAANVGARALRAECEHIEHAVRDGRVEEARARVAETLPALLPPVLAALEGEVAA